MRPALALSLLLGTAQPARSQDGGVPPSAQASESELRYEAVATATRTPRPLRDVPTSVTVLRRAEIALQPTLTTDSLLRSLPSALTFRRSSSLVADPSSQGLNLRGVGPSGVSRTLVLVDGVPANDPFAGSIYWRALPRIGIERVEVVPGGGSALYGSAALAGVVQLFSRPLHTSVEADASYGSFHTMQLAGRGAYERPRGGFSLEGEWLRSDGFQVVRAAQRGPIDSAAESQHGALNARAETRLSERVSLFAGARLFREDQNGGTRYTTARVDSALLTLGALLSLEHEAELRLSLHGRLQRFEQARARIAEGRGSEALAARQDVPADDEGLSLVYTSPRLELAGTHVVSVGLDARRVQGVSRERISPAMVGPGSLVSRDAGGEQLLSGLFASDLVELHPMLQLELALRADGVWNRAGERVLRRADGSEEPQRFAARASYALSPRLSLLLRPLAWLALRGSGYRAFRAPTLNELYRPFQVGTILTAANEQLEPELLHGFEGGTELTPTASLTLRATGFWNRIDAPISNYTLAAPLPDGAMRERRNLGSAVVRGLEANLEWRLLHALTGVLGYTFVASEVRDEGPLRDKQLPQDPRHRASALLLLELPVGFSASLLVRYLGAQYEDDLNSLRMAPYALVDLSAGYRVWWNLELFAAAENLLDTHYVVGRAGIDTIGQPFFVRGGLRLREASRR